MKHGRQRKENEIAWSSRDVPTVHRRRARLTNGRNRNYFQTNVGKFVMSMLKKKHNFEKKPC